MNSNADDALEQIRDLTAGGAQFAFECVGKPAALVQAYAATRRGGTTVSVGLPDPRATVPLRRSHWSLKNEH